MIDPHPLYNPEKAEAYRFVDAYNRGFEAARAVGSSGGAAARGGLRQVMRRLPDQAENVTPRSRPIFTQPRSVESDESTCGG